jgi:hypothetical protein
VGKHAAPKRKRSYEDEDFAKFLGRALAAMERRASENPEALALLMTLQDEMKDSVNRAGHRLHVEAGFSLGDIARFLTFEGHAMSRQNAVKRWGPASVARALGLTSITERINARRTALKDAAHAVWGDELAARRAAKEAV